ncbi:MAG: acyl-ACP--UDP-N-acetylglucosamine O-acyltransferase [Candidatus Kapaibacteriales bacterium]
MSSFFHPTSIVSPKAQIGENVKIGPFTIIEDDVIISDNTEVYSNVFISNGAIIGRNCKIYPGVIIGTKPQDLKFNNEPTKVIIGDNNEIREYSTIHRGTQSTGATIIGNNNLIMAYTHIAHDCRVGSNNVFANLVQLSGHVHVEDWVVFGGVSKVVQFCKIGSHAMVGGDVKVAKDIAPFTLVADNPPKVYGINKIGLRRRGFPPELVKEIDYFYKIVFHSGLNNTDGINKYLQLRDNETIPSEIIHSIEFIRNSQRGVYR